MHLRIQYRPGPFRFLSFIILSLLLLSSCSNVVSSTATRPTVTAMPLPADLLVPHVLTVGNYPDYLPQEYLDPATEQVTGFDIDLIKALALRLNLKVNIVYGDFQSLILHLTTRSFDVVISAVSITPQLEAKVSFIPYFQGGETLLVLKDNPQKIQSLADLCGQTVGVKASSFEQSDLQAASNKCKNDGKALITTVVVQKDEDVVSLLSAHSVVATYQDAPVVDYLIKSHLDLLERAGPILDRTIEGIAVRKDDTTMFNDLKSALDASKVDGTYHALIVKWGVVSGELSPGSRHS